MSYLVFDTETTGLPDWSKPADADGQPRLASWCMLFVDDDLEIEHRHYGLVKPDGWIMSLEAEAVNGLSNERLLSEGTPIRDALELFTGAIMDGRKLVAHNLSFDTKIMRGELRRAKFSDDSCVDGICTMRELTRICQIPKNTGKGLGNGLKFPRLEEACRILLNKDLPGAHNALVDAKACLWLLREMDRRRLLNNGAA